MKKGLIVYFLVNVIQVVFAQSKNENRIDLPVGYDLVDVKPEFPGGINGFMKFVMKNYQAPEDDGITPIETGTVEVSIVINADGSVSNIKIIKEVGSCGKEIKRVLSKCPKWTPGRQKGENVAVIYNFPIKIQ
jgi:hypothetical protein